MHFITNITLWVKMHPNTFHFSQLCLHMALPVLPKPPRRSDMHERTDDGAPFRSFIDLLQMVAPYGHWMRVTVDWFQFHSQWDVLVSSVSQSRSWSVYDWAPFRSHLEAGSKLTWEGFDTFINRNWIHFLFQCFFFSHFEL